METGATFAYLPEKTLLISDVHLGGFDNETNSLLESDFLAILNWCRDNEFTIILLGDIFDYYMQYGNFVPAISRKTINWFRSYHTQTQKNVLFITGNHDNWDFGYLAMAGFDTEHEYRFLQTSDKKKVLLFHGDGLRNLKPGFERPVFHRLLRNPYFVKLFKSVTNGETGNRIMHKFSVLSRKNDDGSNADKIILDSQVSELLQQNFADVVICGHHHEIRDTMVNGKRYINTGAFFIDRTACLYTKGTFQLVSWNASSNTITPLNRTNC